MAQVALTTRLFGWLLAAGGTFISAQMCDHAPKKPTHKTTFQVTASREYYAEADERVRPMKMVGHLNHEQMVARKAEGKEYFIARFDKQRRLLAVEKKVGGKTVLRVDYNYTDKKIQELRWVPKPGGS
jgi:hypothetical protein